ncbi:hypothetical protein PR048_016186 [Dryococelus australis]|uniref:Uncharacterized protein n=1 Tax=Dryococelus australis TaxID=614101 RepID=A0ABQ9HJ18_9NEOP|nr:hypothetical protein PR048_016186 [Dryococelus australis]
MGGQYSVASVRQTRELAQVRVFCVLSLRTDDLSIAMDLSSCTRLVAIIDDKSDRSLFGRTGFKMPENAEALSNYQVGRTPVGTPLPRSRSEGAIRATLTRTPSTSSLLRARLYFARQAEGAGYDMVFTGRLRAAREPNERARETRDPREKPPTNGIVRNDPHLRKFDDPAGIEPGSPGWEVSRLAAQPQRRQVLIVCEVRGIVRQDYHLRKTRLNRPGIEPDSSWWEACSLTAQPTWQRDYTSEAVRRLYQELYPRRETPSHTLFTTITQRLREQGTFTADRNDCGAPKRHSTPELEETVLHHVEQSTSASKRTIARAMVLLPASSRRFCMMLRALCRRTLKARSDCSPTTRPQDGEAKGVPRSAVARLHDKQPSTTALRVQSLGPAIFAPRVIFARGSCTAAPTSPSPRSVLFTDECKFTRNSVLNSRNSYVGAEKNPNTTNFQGFQRRFSINVWAGILDGHPATMGVTSNGYSGTQAFFSSVCVNACTGGCICIIIRACVCVCADDVRWKFTHAVRKDSQGTRPVCIRLLTLWDLKLPSDVGQIHLKLTRPSLKERLSSHGICQKLARNFSCAVEDSLLARASGKLIITGRDVGNIGKGHVYHVTSVAFALVWHPSYMNMTPVSTTANEELWVEGLPMTRHESPRKTSLWHFDEKWRTLTDLMQPMVFTACHVACNEPWTTSETILKDVKQLVHVRYVPAHKGDIPFSVVDVRVAFSIYHSTHNAKGHARPEFVFTAVPFTFTKSVVVRFTYENASSFGAAI